MALISLEPSPAKTPAPLRSPFSERGALQLFVRRESFFSDFRDCVAALVGSAPRESLIRSPYFRREQNPLRQKYSGRSASLSLLLHCAVVALLVYLPQLVPAEVAPGQSPVQATHTIYYYRIPVNQLPQPPRPLSAVASHHAAPRPAPPRPPELPAPPKSTLAAIVSKPARPDNFRQTIYQSAAPPDLIIKSEQKLPNIVILQQNQQNISAPLTPSYAKPAAVAQSVQTNPAPLISSANSPNVTGAMLELTDSNPQLTIPAAGGGTPIARGTTAEGPPSNAPELVAVGVDPADATNQVSLPNGNRWGEFSIAPPAQPSASHDAVSGAGKGRNGQEMNGAGDASHGISGAAGPAGPVDIAGSANGTSGLLSSTLAVNLVYPVAQPLNAIRRNTMVISTGPIGGGGLNVYGALNCGKIYSIFLPMPGRNWSLQYCDRSSTQATAAAASRTQVLHLDPPLVPPDVDLDHRYNFKRIAVPPPNGNRPIILKGVIESDGTVQKLVVYRGVSAEMDEAARIAFGRWRFKPAMRDGKAVAVDILVGIPPANGQDYVNR